MIAMIILLLSLGLDTLAIAIGLGVGGLQRTRWLRVGVTFACFEGLMPIAGLLLGQGLANVAGDFAGYAAALLLIGVGVLAIKEALDDDNADASVNSKTEGWALLLTGLAVSLDELAVGFELGVLRVPVGVAVGFIAVQAFVITFVGLAIGRRIGQRVGSHAELASGVVLTLLGMALFVSQATGSHFL